MISLQLDLFESNEDSSLIMRELKNIQDALDRRTRAQFKLINDMSKIVIQLKEENHELRMAMIHRKK